MQKSVLDRNEIKDRACRRTGRACAKRQQFSVCAAIALSFLLLTVATACGEDPTPVPEATPHPTATPTPVTLAELRISEESTVGQLVALLSASERMCIEERFGAESFAAMQEVPLAIVPDGAGQIPLDCLTTENAIDTGMALLDWEAGGLSDSSRICVRDVVSESPFVLGIGEPPAVPAAAFGRALQMQLCLTDDEAAALSTGGEDDLPSPSMLRCIERVLGGPAEIGAILNVDPTDEVAAEDAAFRLLSAALACEDEAG